MNETVYMQAQSMCCIGMIHWPDGPGKHSHERQTSDRRFSLGHNSNIGLTLDANFNPPKFVYFELNLFRSTFFANLCQSLSFLKFAIKKNSFPNCLFLEFL